jgi:hypothetical protein
MSATVLLSDVVNDFMLLHSDDDYVNNIDLTKLRVLGKRGIREIGFDISRVVRVAKLVVNIDNMTAPLPDDYVNWIKIGTIGEDGLFYVFAENNNISMSEPKKTGDVLNFQEIYLNDSRLTIPRGYGGIYGMGGGQHHGEFRVNMEENRVELQTNETITEIDIEYISDNGIATNPAIHTLCVDALDKYMYNEIVKRSTIVPYNEKIRADRDWKEAMKTANSRMRTFRKEKALDVIRKNTKLSPRY